MMLITERTPQGSVALLSLPEDHNPPSFSETIWAAFRQNNTVVSWLSEERVVERLVSGYDQFEDIAGYELYARSFIGATSPEEVAAVKRQIDKELKDSEKLATYDRKRKR